MNEFADRNNFDEESFMMAFSKIFIGLQSIKDNVVLLSSLGIKSISLEEKMSGFKKYPIFSGFIQTDTQNINIQYSIGLNFEATFIDNNPIINSYNIDNKFYTLKKNESLDKPVIEQMIKDFSVYDPSIIESRDYTTYPMSIKYDGVICNDISFAEFFVKSIGYNLGFINQDEYQLINKEFGFGSKGLHFPELESKMFASFEQSFNVLKEYEYDKDNSFDFNDMDNEMKFFETEELKGILYGTQNKTFIVLQNKKTGQMKGWSCMDYYENWFEDLYFEFEEQFNAVEFLNEYANKNFGMKNIYPFDFTNEGYFKHFSFYLNNFNYSGLHCLYDSNLGFNMNEFQNRNSLVFEILVANQNLCDEHDIEISKESF